MFSYIPNPLIIPVGLIMGVLLAMPLGPANLLGLQRAVERGFFGGMAAAIGIILGDGLMALAAAMGVNAISGTFREYRTAIQIVGGLVLLGAGLKLYLAPVSIAVQPQAEKASLRDYMWDIPQMFLLTITNPGSVLALVSIFGGVSSFVDIDSHIDAFTLVAATMSGTFLYWFVVCERIARVRHRLNEVQLGKINRLAALALIAFGVVMIAEMALRRLRLW